MIYMICIYICMYMYIYKAKIDERNYQIKNVTQDKNV